MNQKNDNCKDMQADFSSYFSDQGKNNRIQNNRRVTVSENNEKNIFKKESLRLP